jgi:hypothetical protein
MRDTIGSYAAGSRSDRPTDSPSDAWNESASARPTPGVRALIVYQHALLRDLVTKVLGTSGVEIVAAVRPEHLDASLLDLLKPEVLVVDQAAFGTGSPFESAPLSPALLGREPEVASRLVLVDLSDPRMLVWQRHLVANTDAQKLVRAVLEHAPEPV